MGAFLANSETLVDSYISSRKGDKGLTTKGEAWIRGTLPLFLKTQGKHTSKISLQDIQGFLFTYNDKPWRKHSFYRAIKAFFNWLYSPASGMGLPLQDNPTLFLKPPKVPKVILPHPTLDQIRTLIGHCQNPRDKAIIGVLADTGRRLSEVAAISRMDFATNTFTVMGKGGKQHRAKISNTTAQYLKAHLDTYSSNGNIWGIRARGIQIMLKRLGQATGIKCNAHSFRRFWAIENRHRGMDLIDIKNLGGWESLEMVERYAREADNERALAAYQPILS